MFKFLSPEKFRTLERLAHAVSILSQAEFSIAELNEAKTLLKRFAGDVKRIYGKSNVVMNIHLVTHHLATVCADYGPLWVFWCYPFESMLGYMKRFIHSKKCPEKRFIFGAQVMRICPILENKEAKNYGKCSHHNKTCDRQNNVTAHSILSIS